MKIREHQSRIRKPGKTNFGKNGDRVPPTSAMVLSLPASLCKYEKILNFKLIEITS